MTKLSSNLFWDKLNVPRENLALLKLMQVSSIDFDSPELDLQLRMNMSQDIGIYSSNTKKIMQIDTAFLWPRWFLSF